MTGGQDSSALGKIEDICEGVGVNVDHIHILNPIQKEHDKNLAIVQQELEYTGVSVIIPRRECLHTVARRIRADKKAKLAKENIE